jgi:acyl-CoA thioesterase-1
MKRICFVGASTVEGMGDETGMGWPGRLCQNIRDKVVPYNLGVRGQTLNQIYARAERECKARILDKNQAGIVLCSGLNDLGHLENGSRRTRPERVPHNFERLVETLADIVPTIVVGPMPVYEEKMPYTSVIIGDVIFRNADVAEIDHTYKMICSELGIDYLSQYPTLINEDRYTKSLAGNDGLHPTGGGYQLVADIVADWQPWQKLRG